LTGEGHRTLVPGDLYESVDDFLERRPGYDARRLRQGVLSLEKQSMEWERQDRRRGFALSSEGEARRLLFLAAVLIRTQEIRTNHVPPFLADFTAAL
jgi:hypothetical protein